MKEYVVQSGPLKITVIADCPRDAALEAVTCWSGCNQEALPQQTLPQRPGGVQPELVVRRRGYRVARYFSAVRMLARIRGQSVSTTWKQLLRSAAAAPN